MHLPYNVDELVSSATRYRHPHCFHVSRLEVRSFPRISIFRLRGSFEVDLLGIQRLTVLGLRPAWARSSLDVHLCPGPGVCDGGDGPALDPECEMGEVPTEYGEKGITGLKGLPNKSSRVEPLVPSVAVEKLNPFNSPGVAIVKSLS